MGEQGLVAALLSTILLGQSMRVLTVERPGDADSLHISKRSVAVGFKNFSQIKQDGNNSEVEREHPLMVLKELT